MCDYKVSKWKGLCKIFLPVVVSSQHLVELSVIFVVAVELIFFFLLPILLENRCGSVPIVARRASYMRICFDALLYFRFSITVIEAQ